MPSLLEPAAPTALTRHPVPSDSNTLVTRMPDAASRPVKDEIPEIPGFTILRVIGQGGMGIVYEAEDQLGLRFAIKMVLRELSEDNQARFRKEAQAMAALEHPNIAGILTYGAVAGRPYLVMKYHPGGTLHDRKSEYQADTRKAARLLAQVADALAYLHSQGVIHRDIKPRNILLDANDAPLLADFGLVKRFGSESEGNRPEDRETPEASPSADTALEISALQDTRVGTVLGSVQYMCPEQARGRVHEAGPAWDAWSMGVVFFELAAGKLPFAKAGAGFAGAADLLGASPLPSSVNPRVHRTADRIVAACLQLDPAKRPGAAWLRDRLRAFADPIPWFRRKPIPHIGFTLLCAVLASLFLLWPGQRSPEIARKTVMEARLAAFDRDGKTIDFLTPDGAAALPLAFASPPQYGNLFTDMGAFRISASEPCLLDVLPGMPAREFVLRAQVRFLKPLTANFWCGIYIGRRSEVFDANPMSRCLLHAVRVRPNGTEPTDFVQYRGPWGVSYAPAAATSLYQTNWARDDKEKLDLAIDPDAWHEMSFENRSDGATMRIDGHILRTALPLSAARLRNLPHFPAQMTTNDFAPFSKAGGIGLMVSEGGVLLKRLRVEGVAGGQ